MPAQPSRAIAVSFLTSGPPLALQLPAEFAAPPVLATVIDAGRGGRECIYWPAELDRFPGEEQFDREDDAPARAGVAAQVWRRKADPLLWFVRWELPGGAVMMHLRDDDLEVGGPHLIAGHVQVLQQDGVVAVLPDPPLQRAVSRRPGYAERITFYATTPDGAMSGPALLLERPGARRAGAAQRIETGGPEHVLARGTGRGIDVTLAVDWDEAEAVAVLSDLGDQLA